MTTNEISSHEADDLALSDLTTLYRALWGARAAFDGAISQVGDSANIRAGIQKALIREERNEVAARIDALCVEIESKPTRDAADSFEKLRIRRIEFGQEPAPADFYTQPQPHGALADGALAEKLEEIECQLDLIVFALSVESQSNGRHGPLVSATDILRKQLGELRHEVFGGAEMIEHAA